MRQTRPTILITGASRGIGLDLACSFAEDGARVIATCRRPQAAHELGALAARYDVDGSEIPW
ncbi:MAG TPA: SDR family NAD(P)-dependent oxidoreductase [Thermoanaerobaculia bacterium]|nr:SDR family NAD(P)-dependent oxidoreductase [Thermoanaerobaculia bacterium]